MHEFPIADIDKLDHDAHARRLLQRLHRLPDGWAVALRGPWGRGKTDLMGRLERLVAGAEASAAGGFGHVLAISPWRYPQPDLLTPLVTALIDSIPRKERAGKDALKKAARTVLSGGLAFGLKAAARLVPGGGILEDAGTAFEKIIEGLFEAQDLEEGTGRPDPDPVLVMSTRFKELVEALITYRSSIGRPGRLLVCIDDLDRCLPAKQVAFLEAMHLLKASGR